MRRTVTIVILLALLAAGACSRSSPTSPSPPSPVALVLTAETVTVARGATQTLTVQLLRSNGTIARRLMRLTGAVTVEDPTGYRSIHGVRAYLGERVVVGQEFSAGMSRFTIPVGQPQPGGVADIDVAPGDIRLVIRLQPTDAAAITWVSLPESLVEVRDAETGQVPSTLPLGVQSVTKPAVPDAIGEFVWTLTIPAFH